VARHRYRRGAVVVFVLAAALMSAAARAQQKIGSDFLVTNVRVFDGQQTLPNTHVAVTGRVIRAVGGDVSAWRSLPTIDGTESTLVPGLVDAHVHVRNADELRQALRLGVTTVLDMGTFALTPGDMSTPGIRRPL
jgi:dihydroorotase-like cyclic amidohydrolase